MKINLITLVVSFLLLISMGCTSITAKKDNAIREDVKVAMAEVGYKCEKVIMTGSNIKKTRCSTAKQREQQRETARRVVLERQSGGPEGEDRNSL